MAQKDSIRRTVVQLERAMDPEAEAPLTAFGDAMRAGQRPAEVTLILKTAGYAIAAHSFVSAAIHAAGLWRSTGGLVGSRVTALKGTVQTASATSVDTGTEAALLGGAPLADGLGDAYRGSLSARAQRGDAAAQMFLATLAYQERNQQFSLRYLQLQEAMQAESRQYTALSNIMKAKHDAAMNIINNIR